MIAVRSVAAWHIANQLVGTLRLSELAKNNLQYAREKMKDGLVR